MEMSAFPDIKTCGNGQIGKKGCRQKKGMSGKLADIDVSARHVANMSPTFPTKLCMQKLKIPEGADKRDIWERVIVPSMRMKYTNMKCNLNNDIKLIYLSMMKYV